MGAAGPAARREEGEYSPHLTDEQRGRRAGSARFGDGRLPPRAARALSDASCAAGSFAGDVRSLVGHRASPQVGLALLRENLAHLPAWPAPSQKWLDEELGLW